MKSIYDDCYMPEPVLEYWSVQEYDGAGNMEWMEHQKFLSKDKAMEYVLDFIKYRHGEDHDYGDVNNYRFQEKNSDYIAVEFKKPGEKSWSNDGYIRTDIAIYKESLMVVK